MTHTDKIEKTIDRISYYITPAVFISKGILVLVILTSIISSLLIGPSCWNDETNICVGEATPTENRTVLMELFTQTWCGPCKNSDLATDKLREDYSNDKLAILEFHYNQGGDPFFTDETDYRFNRYYDFDSWPSAMFDGQIKEKGSGEIDALYDRYVGHVESRLQEKSHFFIRIFDSSHDGITVSLKSYIRERSDSDRNNITVFTVIFRDKLSFDGGNGITEHRYVVRKLFSEPFEGPTTNVEYNFTLPDDSPYMMSGDNIGIVVFVQDDDTHEVLQVKMQLLYTGDTKRNSNGEDTENSAWYTKSIFFGALGMVIVILGVGGFMMMTKSKSVKTQERRKLQSHSHARKRLSSGQHFAKEKRNKELVSCPECGVMVKKINLDSHLSRVHHLKKT